jgi:putative transposase
MVVENPTWGAPRFHGELLMLGFWSLWKNHLSLDETGVERSRTSQTLARLPSKPQGSDCGHGLLHRANDHLWRALLLLVISHGRRRIPALQRHEASDQLWVVQRLREAFPFELAPRFLIFDRDAKYRVDVPVAVRSLKLSPVQSGPISTW